LDENVDVEVAVRLRLDGYDVLTARDAGMLGRSDEEQLEFAASQRRALFTHDIRTFRPLAQQWIRSGREHWGVIYSSRRPPGALYEELKRILSQYPAPNALCNCTTGLP
ncbi:MAG TPA: DUF5615 family PIN-like protein, partial [Dehalococcoidia bacterium]|nr:DUF5615 family PIN-like protein [Dehalococcoidia bacterium]